MAQVIDIFAFNIEKLLVWIGKFNPDRILDAICRAGRDVWNAWRKFFFGLDFDKHVYVLNMFLPRMPRFTERMESVYERVLSEDVPMSLEDCLEHDIEVQPWYRRDIYGEEKGEDGKPVRRMVPCREEVSGTSEPVPAELAPRGFGAFDDEDIEEPALVYGPHEEGMYDALSEEEFDKILDVPFPTTPDVNVALAKQKCEELAYNRKEAREQRTRVRPGYMKKAIEAVVAHLRVNHNIMDQGMNVVDEAAMRVSATDLCVKYKLNTGCTLAIVQSASYLALVPDEKSIDAVKLAYNPQASGRRTLISTLRKTIWAGDFKSLEDF